MVHNCEVDPTVTETMNSARKWFLNALRRLRRAGSDRRGNVAIITALTAIPIITVAGGILDISQAVNVQSKMQYALDAATLVASKNAAGQTPTQLATTVSTAFNAEFQSPLVSNVTITPTYTTNGVSQLNIVATGNYSPAFGGIIGITSIGVKATTQVAWGGSRLRVALVLDNTGSMSSSGKITALKSATTSLLNQLKGIAVNPGDVYVSITPFSKDINVGTSNVSAQWIDWTDWNANNGSCKVSKSKTAGTTQATCTGTWTSAAHSTWNGCITDRGDAAGPNTGAYDANVVAPATGQTATLFPAEQYANCPQAGIGLTYDWTALNQVVTNMSPNGSTNQTIGLAHGWMSLVGGGPYPAPPSLDPNYTYHQVIILLSDGLNTQDRWYGNGSNTSTQVDARMTAACTNAKAAGMLVYTVQVNTSGDPTSTVLQNCASGSSYFYQVTSSSGINAVFQQIGVGLSDLRVAG